MINEVLTFKSNHIEIIAEMAMFTMLCACILRVSFSIDRLALSNSTALTGSVGSAHDRDVAMTVRETVSLRQERRDRQALKRIRDQNQIEDELDRANVITETLDAIQAHNYVNPTLSPS